IVDRAYGTQEWYVRQAGPPYGGQIRSSACKRSERSYPQQIGKSQLLIFIKLIDAKNALKSGRFVSANIMKVNKKNGLRRASRVRDVVLIFD
ncbi:hypothetical protein AMJ85_08215, partial [candidate division BRC1 bacterium SM23_51]